MTYITAPASIDNTGHLDESVALSDWLSTTKVKTGRTQLRLRRPGGTGPGVYKVRSGVWCDNPHLDLDLNGCWLITDEGPGEDTKAIAPELNQSWPRRRAVLNIGDDTKVWSSVAGARLMGGGRRAGGTARWRVGIAYEAKLEGQHGIRVRGSGCVLDLSNVEVGWVYGDGVYVEWWVNGCEIRGRTNLACAREDRPGKDAIVMRGGPEVWDRVAYWNPPLQTYPGIHHTGRQGIAMSGGRDLYVHYLTMWSIGRSAFDFEPGANGTLDGVTVERVVTGSLENVWVASAGKGYVNNVTFEDCVNVHKPLRVIVRDTNTPPNRRRNWEFLRNKADRKAFHGSPLACMRFEAVDGVTLRDNLQYVDKRQAGRGTYFEDCTGVDVPNESSQFVLV